MDKEHEAKILSVGPPGGITWKQAVVGGANGPGKPNVT